MAQYLKAGADILQHLGHVFAQFTEPAAAVGAGVMTGHMGVNFARKMLRQGAAARLRRGGPLRGSCRLNLFHSVCSLQVFKLELQLLDLAQHLLALAAEQHLVQLRDQQHQSFDLTGTRVERPRVALMLGNHECLQRFNIKRLKVRKCSSKHVRSMP